MAGHYILDFSDVSKMMAEWYSPKRSLLVAPLRKEEYNCGRWEYMGVDWIGLYNMTGAHGVKAGDM